MRFSGPRKRQGEAGRRGCPRLRASGEEQAGATIGNDDGDESESKSVYRFR